MVVGACQSFQFSRQITRFLRNNRELRLNLGIGFRIICITELVLSDHKK